MDNIVRLEGAQRVRCRPAVIFGSDDARGALMAVKMLVELFLEEGAAGHSSHLELTLLEDGTVILRDDGRGIYFGEGDALWQALFCQLYAGSAYEEASKRNIFEKCDAPVEDGSNLELYGVVCVCAHMHILTKRDGFAYALRFEKGQNVGGLQKQPCSEPAGTQIVFAPDPQVFTDVTLDPEQLADLMRTAARKAPGLHTVFRRQTPDGLLETVHCTPKE